MSPNQRFLGSLGASASSKDVIGTRKLDARGTA